MSGNHFANRASPPQGAAFIPWSAPWHARLKNLADSAVCKEAYATAVAGVQGSWMGRARLRVASLPGAV